MEDKIFKFKGKTVEELKALSVEDFSKLVESTLRRKITRGFSEQEERLLIKLRRNEKNIKTHCRDMVVLPEMVDIKISVYTGREFLLIHIVPEMIGLRLGELAPSRKIGVKHSGGGAKKTVVRK